MSTSRRMLLAGLAAVPAAPTLALAIHADAALLAMHPRIEAVNAAYRAALKRVDAADTLRMAGRPSPDLDAARAAEDAANDAWAELRDEVMELPAKTIDGICVKLSVTADPWDDPEMMSSVVQDILAMRGGGA